MEGNIGLEMGLLGLPRRVVRELRRACSSYVTTPIFYANGAPHIGHLYTSAVADAAHRWLKIRQPTVAHAFLSGTDEHGSKILKAATAAGREPQEFCDLISAEYRRLFHVFDVHPTTFVRTTSESHVRAVQEFWNKLDRGGYIEKGAYSGWYSTADEAFYSNKEVRDEEQPGGPSVKVSIETGRPVEWVEEENFVFRIDSLKPRILEWLNTQDVVRPREQLGNLLHWAAGQRNPSISRESRRGSWGVAVPGEPTQTVYVWLDALVGYLSGVGWPDTPTAWPPTLQILGRDIATFHAVFWPAFLLAADLPLPKRLFIHAHWQVDKVKMSKSLGNVVDPFAEGEVIGNEALRYFLIRHPVPKKDSSYTRLKATELVNDELANVLGNLLSRCTAKGVNPDLVYPSFAESEEALCHSGGDELLAKVDVLLESVSVHYAEMEMCRAADAVIGLLRDANAFFTAQAPWKAGAGTPETAATLFACLEALRVGGVLLQPLLPTLSARLLDALAVPESRRRAADAVLDRTGPRRLLRPPGTPLFPRLKVVK